MPEQKDRVSSWITYLIIGNTSVLIASFVVVLGIFCINVASPSYFDDMKLQIASSMSGRDLKTVLESERNFEELEKTNRTLEQRLEESHAALKEANKRLDAFETPVKERPVFVRKNEKDESNDEGNLVALIEESIEQYLSIEKRSKLGETTADRLDSETESQTDLGKWRDSFEGRAFEFSGTIVDIAPARNGDGFFAVIRTSHKTDKNVGKPAIVECPDLFWVKIESEMRKTLKLKSKVRFKGLLTLKADDERAKHLTSTLSIDSYIGSINLISEKKYDLLFLLRFNHRNFVTIENSKKLPQTEKMLVFLKVNDVIFPSP